MSEEIIAKRYDSLYNDVKTFFVTTLSGKLTIGSVAVLTRYAMEVVQTTKNWSKMKGSEKHALVYGVIKALIKDLLQDPQVVGDNFDPHTAEGILLALDMVPVIIDSAVEFAKTYKSTGGFNFSCCPKK